MKEFIMLKNVRCSFPALFAKPIIRGKEGSMGAKLMLGKKEHAALIKEIREEVEAVCFATWEKKSLASDKLCLRDGDEQDRDEYEGYFTVSANCTGSKRPIVFATHGGGVISDEKDCPIYSGCRVNAKIRLWAQDNDYGKRVNAELVAIQFKDDDEPLSAGHVPIDKAMDGFDGLDDADGDGGF